MLDQIVKGMQNLKEIKDSHSVIDDYMSREPVKSPCYFIPEMAKQYLVHV